VEQSTKHKYTDPDCCTKQPSVLSCKLWKTRANETQPRRRQKKVAQRYSSHFANASLGCFSGGRRLMSCACVHSQLSTFYTNRTKQWWKRVMMSSSQDIHASDPAEIIDIVVLIAEDFGRQTLRSHVFGPSQCVSTLSNRRTTLMALSDPRLTSLSHRDHRHFAESIEHQLETLSKSLTRCYRRRARIIQSPNTRRGSETSDEDLHRFQRPSVNATTAH
jgi:hypothetical protein